jgi:hypothetical protein
LTRDGQAKVSRHLRFGGSAGSTGLGASAFFSDAAFCRPHANVMQRFRPRLASTTASWLEAGTAGVCGFDSSAMATGGICPWAFLERDEGKITVGGGGLGVFDLSGLVIPPSLVSSAVDGMLTMLWEEAVGGRLEAMFAKPGNSVPSGLCSGLLSRPRVRSDSRRLRVGGEISKEFMREVGSRLNRP